MAAATPTLEAVLDAIESEMTAISGFVGTVRKFDRTLEDEYEYLDLVKSAVDAQLDLWIVEVESVNEEEAEAAGEQYSLYNVTITYTNVRMNDPEWSKKARLEAEKVRDALNQNAAIFAIGGQRQLRTPETVSLRAHGRETTESDNPQMVYRPVLELQVEARRFA